MSLKGGSKICDSPLSPTYHLRKHSRRKGPQNTTLGSKRPKNNTLGSTPVNKGRKNTSLATTPVENGPKTVHQGKAYSNRDQNVGSFIHSFLPEQEVAEIHKGVNAVNSFVLFFSHPVLSFGEKAGFR